VWRRHFICHITCSSCNQEKLSSCCDCKLLDFDSRRRSNNSCVLTDSSVVYCSHLIAILCVCACVCVCVCVCVQVLACMQIFTRASVPVCRQINNAGVTLDVEITGCPPVLPCELLLLLLLLPSRFYKRGAYRVERYLICNKTRLIYIYNRHTCIVN
jgi:hypothetical protein